MKTTYTVPEVPGSKRTSERPYSHAIIARRDLARERIEAASSEHAAQDRRNYAYEASCAACKPGDRHPAATRFHFEISAAEIERAAAGIMAHPSLEAYQAAQLARRLANIDEIGTGNASDLFVVQWSMSRANAEKGLSKCAWLTDVRIVECVPVTR